jgi:hypothetical protein
VSKRTKLTFSLLPCSGKSRGKKTEADLISSPQDTDDDYQLRLIKLPKMFTPFIYGWLKATEEKLVSWSDTARQHDEFRPLTESVRHSTSVSDTFVAATEVLKTKPFPLPPFCAFANAVLLSQALHFLRSLETTNPFILVQFAELLCGLAETYSKRLRAQVEHALPPETDESTDGKKKRGHRRFGSVSPPENVSLNTSASVPLNGSTPADGAARATPLHVAPPKGRSSGFSLTFLFLSRPHLLTFALRVFQTFEVFCRSTSQQTC